MPSSPLALPRVGEGPHRSSCEVSSRTVVNVVFANVGKIAVYRGDGPGERELDSRSSRTHSKRGGAGAHSEFSVLYGCPRPKRGASRDHGRGFWHVRQRASANRYDLGIFEGTAADSFASGLCVVYAPSSRRCVNAREDVGRPTSTASAMPISVPGCARVRTVEPH